MTPFPSEAARTPLSRLTTVELRKLADTRAGLWLLLSTALVAAAITALVVAVGEPQDRALDGLVEATIGLTSVLLPIVGILAVTGEFSQRTALMTFTLVPRRERVVAAKLVAGVLLAVVASAVCLVVAAIGTAVSGGEWSLSAGELAGPALDQLLGVLKGTALGLAVMISPLAIVLYFVLPITIGILVATIPGLDGIGSWIDGSITFAALLQGELGGADWGRMAVGVAVWVGIPLAIGLVRLRRHELA